MHPQFNSRLIQNDIALLQLNSPIDFASFDNKVAPICLPFYSKAPTYVGKMATVIGWGTTSYSKYLKTFIEKELFLIVTTKFIPKSYYYFFIVFH